MSDKQERRSSEEIEAEIRQTREDLDDTLHELEDRLSPRQFMDTAYDHVRNGGANEFFVNLGNTIKQNPVPVLLIGIGIGWLMVTHTQASQKASDRTVGRNRHRYRTPGTVTTPTTPVASTAASEDAVTGANRPVTPTEMGAAPTVSSPGAGAGTVGEATHLGTAQHKGGGARPGTDVVGEATHLGTHQDREGDASTKR